jgi:hypothetical protein
VSYPPNPIVPAQAGTQADGQALAEIAWAPAFAGEAGYWNAL